MIERHYRHYCSERGAAHVAWVFGAASLDEAQHLSSLT